MGKKEKKRTALGTAVGTVGMVVTARERLNAFLRPFALAVGAMGTLALLGCGVLYLLPHARWPLWLDPAGLPLYGLISIIASSLLGWGCLQDGLGNVRDMFGDRLGGLLFVLVPMATGTTVWLAERKLVEPAAWPGAPWTDLLIRWYAPGLMILAVVSFLTVKTRLQEEGRLKRGMWWTLMLLPCGLLMATLMFGVKAPFLDESLRHTLNELGSTAIVLQVALAYFFASGSR